MWVGHPSNDNASRSPTSTWLSYDQIDPIPMQSKCQFSNWTVQLLGCTHRLLGLIIWNRKQICRGVFPWPNSASTCSKISARLVEIGLCKVVMVHQILLWGRIKEDLSSTRYKVSSIKKSLERVASTF